MGCLYKLTSPSGKSYIGISSKGLEARWKKHVEHALGKRTSGALYAALRKYGPETFERQVLAECDRWELLCEMECEAIRVHGTLSPHGYNVTLGGEGVIGPRDESFRQKVSIAQRERFKRPDQRALLERNRLLAIEATRKKWQGRPRWRKARVSVPLSAEQVSQRIKDGMAAPDVRDRVLACAKARAASPEWRLKISASKRGVKLPPCSDAARAAHSEGAKRMWQRRKQGASV